MKKFTKVLVLYSLIFILIACSVTGCGKKDSAEKTIDYLKDLKSYACDVEISIKNDKQELKMNGKQYYLKNKGCKFEAGSDRIIVYKNGKMNVTDLKNDKKYASNEEFDKFYQLSFIGKLTEMMYSNEKIKSYSKKLNKDEYQVMEISIPGDNKNLSKCILYVNKETNSPAWLIILNANKNEVARVTYSNFKANIPMDERLF